MAKNGVLHLLTLVTKRSDTAYYYKRFKKKTQNIINYTKGNKSSVTKGKEQGHVLKSCKAIGARGQSATGCHLLKARNCQVSL